ncbi:hypothetical protein BS50DRAFT_592209 [Corynespora cassiicola Philippines]|uniref:Uncharacterized protein n=1 Tax=Corynespora cassiicola Philippines TaxID=1448308 RepID=A0A2T2N926_CORCC|nr:hypothetical protein BS50DRAFT_592209 [Corynespora cassiicola Philippines]
MEGLQYYEDMLDFVTSSPYSQVTNNLKFTAVESFEDPEMVPAALQQFEKVVRSDDAQKPLNSAANEQEGSHDESYKFASVLLEQLKARPGFSCDSLIALVLYLLTDNHPAAPKLNQLLIIAVGLDDPGSVEPINRSHGTDMDSPTPGGVLEPYESSISERPPQGSKSKHALGLVTTLPDAPWNFDDIHQWASTKFPRYYKNLPDGRTQRYLAADKTRKLSTWQKAVTPWPENKCNMLMYLGVYAPGDGKPNHGSPVYALAYESKKNPDKAADGQKAINNIQVLLKDNATHEYIKMTFTKDMPCIEFCPELEMLKVFFEPPQRDQAHLRAVLLYLFLQKGLIEKIGFWGSFPPTLQRACLVPSLPSEKRRKERHSKEITDDSTTG